nr:phospholipase [Deltaproteobacteria bacterium]
MEPGPRAVLHAKCIVVDGERALVTCANFTEAA